MARKQSRTGEPYVRLHKNYWHLYYRNPDPSKNYPAHKSLRLKAEDHKQAKTIEAEARLVWRKHENEFQRHPQRIDAVFSQFVKNKIEQCNTDGADKTGSPCMQRSFAEVMEEFQASKQNKAKRTRRTYGTHIRNVKRLMDCSISIEHIRPKWIEEYLTKRVERDGVHKTTVNKELTTLRSIFIFAKKRGYVRQNPAKMTDKFSLEPEDKEELSDPVHIPRELYRAMLDSRAARRHPPVRQIMFLLYHTGMRIGELLRLRWKDIDLENHIIHVTASPQKGGDRDPYMVSRQLRLYLAIAKSWARKAYGRGEWSTDLSFERVALIPNGNGKSWNYANLVNRKWWPFLEEFARENPDIFRDLQKAAGVAADEDKPVSFHDFRHTFITDLLTQGVNPVVVGWLVGHKELHTQRRYTHLCYRHFTEEFKDYTR